MKKQNEVVVVTGASQGIGRETVKALCRDHGVDVIAVSRNEAALDALVAETTDGNRAVQPLALDLIDPSAPATIARMVGERSVRALVHNAGALLNIPFGQYESQDLLTMFKVNVFAPLLLTQALVHHLSGPPSGHVVHISSMGGFQDSVKFPGLLGYSSSKAALACLAQCLAEELKELGVSSNCLALGAVDTAMLRRAFPGYTAPTTAVEMGCFVARFAMEGHKQFNGRVLPVSISTP